MKIQNGFNSSYSPAFKKFQIEEDRKNPENPNKTSEFRGTNKFLANETRLFQETKLKEKKPKTIEPVKKIIELIKRQRTNPFDMVMYSVHGKTPEQDKVFLETRKPNGEVIDKKELKNEIKLIKNAENDFDISSDFYEALEMGEKRVDELNSSTN